MHTDPTAQFLVRILLAGLSAILLLSAVPAQSDPAPPPPEEWKSVVPGFNAYVHVGSVARAESKDGSTLLSVWTLQNLDGETVKVGAVAAKSVRTLHTINCKWRTETKVHKVFADWNGAGTRLEETAPRPPKPIEPESFEFALAHKYCSAITFWR